MKRWFLVSGLSALAALSTLAGVHAQGTAFTYQGFLRQSGTPVNTNHDFQFSLWTALSGGTQVGTTLTRANVSVQNGLFTVTLDFGAVWDGSDRFLQIAVRPAGMGSYTALSPRVKINPTPYAIRAGVANPIGAAGGDLSGSYPNPTVAQIRGKPVATTAPSLGQVLKWDGSAWAPAADDVGGLTLPFSGSANVAGAPVFLVENTSGVDQSTSLYGAATATTGAVYGVMGRSDSVSGIGVVGVATAHIGSGGYGGYFTSHGTGGRGVVGYAESTTGSTYGGYFLSASTDGRGVSGWATATSGETVGVWGRSDSTSGRGVVGDVRATTGETYGGWFESASTSGRGVYGWATATSGTTYGVYGRSNSDSGGGVYGLAPKRGVIGVATATSDGANGGWFESASTEGTGVFGVATATSGETCGVRGYSASTSGTGVFGVATATSGTTYGVWGHSNSDSGRGVVGTVNTLSGFTYGGYFLSRSTSGRGVYGLATATSGTTYGVFGETNSTSNWSAGVYGLANAASGDVWGVHGRSNSTNGKGVLGLATATSGETTGVWGESASTSGRGVFGRATATSGFTYGGYFRSDSPDGLGVYGWATATSGTTGGVWGRSDSPSGRGVVGDVRATTGETYGGWFRSNSMSGTGVYGLSTATSGAAYGVWGRTVSSTSNAYGVVGEEPSGGTGHAVYAFGTLGATGTKSFQIDHPLSPETHYLNHFCTEAPEPLNAYSGNVTTDARGYAMVQLPPYFESINRDFRYQLTVIDSSDDFILAKVVREIQNNQFVIRTSKPFVRVSWRVEAIRNDLWVQRYGYQTEQEKEDDIKGKYLNPELYGQPKERGIHYRPEPEPAPNETAKP